MKTNNHKWYCTPYQVKLPVDFERIIEITDPVYTFSEVMDHIDLSKYLVVEENETGRPRYDYAFLPLNSIKYSIFMKKIKGLFSQKLDDLKDKSAGQKSQKCFNLKIGCDQIQGSKTIQYKSEHSYKRFSEPPKSQCIVSRSEDIGRVPSHLSD